MSMIEDLTDKELLYEVINRNVAIDRLKKAKDELLKGRIKMTNMLLDGCHIGNSYYNINKTSEAISLIDSVIKTMESGDWCFSVQSTKKREEKMN